MSTDPKDTNEPDAAAPPSDDDATRQEDDAANERSIPDLLFRNPHPLWDGDVLQSVYECDLDTINEFNLLQIEDVNADATDGSTNKKIRVPTSVGANPELHIIIEGNLSSRELCVNDLRIAQDFLGAIMLAMTFPNPTLLNQLRAAHNVFLDKKTNIMEKRAAVVLHIARAIRHFPLNLENNPPVERCPNCSDVYTRESTCPDCGAKIELPDPIEYFNNMRQGCATGLVWRLAEFAPEFKNLPAEFIVEYLSSGKEPTTIAAYFSCKVGAFGDRGKVWRDVNPVANRYRDACRTESAKEQFAKWREACATVDEHFGPAKR